MTQETSCGTPPFPFRGSEQPRRPDQANGRHIEVCGRAPEGRALRQRRNLKMAGSVHANMPGNALKFYEWLGTADSSTIPVGPPVWIRDKPEADVTMFAAQHPWLSRLCP